MKRIILNRDAVLVKEIREIIKQKGGHCCCAIELNDDNICMCKEFRERVQAGILGPCDCGLYELVEEEDK